MKTGGSLNYNAEAAIPAYRFIKFGAADGGILVAAASTDLLIGGNGRIAADVAGDRLDIVRDDFVEIQLGGTVVRGEKLTSDSSGRAITAAPATGVNAQIGGTAEASGVIGDIIWVKLAPSVMQG
jgi:hypothetical protein